MASIQENLKLSLGMRANVTKGLVTNLLSDYLIQNTELNTLKNFLLGAQVFYRKEKSNLEYDLLFNNIFNINSFNSINNSTNQLGTDELLIMSLRGYVLGGLKLYF